MTFRFSRWVFLGTVFAAVAPGAAARQTDTTAVRNVGFEADSFVVRTVDGRLIRELLRPRLREGSTYVEADRGMDQGQGDYLLTGHVRIVDKGDTLTAERVLYNRPSKIVRATGNVRLGDGEVVVTAPEGDYDTNQKRADFRYGATLVDSLSVLTSRSGSYWTEEKRAWFFGDVRLHGDSLDVVADSLGFQRETRASVAIGDVVVHRLERGGARTWIAGDRATEDEQSGLSRVDGNVFLLRVRPDSTGAAADTLMLTAARLQAVRTDSLERYAAADSVRVWRQRFSAVADSASFERAARSAWRLLGAPLAWFRRMQISGDTIVVVGPEEGMDSLRVVGSAFVARMDSATGRVDQLSGSRLVGIFRGDSLRTLQVDGRAEALYWRAEPDGEGALAVSADRISLAMEEEDRTDIRWYDGVDGTYYAAHLAEQAADLEGFRWVPEREPDAAAMRHRAARVLCRAAPDVCAAGVTDLAPRS